MNTKTRAFRYTIILASIGLMVTILIAYVERSTLRTYERNLPFISLGDNIKNRTTKGHLWFEELMAGDDSNDIERDVLSLFRSSREILDGALNGSQTEMGKFEKSSDETTNQLIAKGIADLDVLIDATNARWAFNQKTLANKDSAATSTGEEAGGDLDQQFDATYEKVQDSMDKLVELVDQNVSADSKYLSNLSWFSIFLMVIIFVVLSYQLFGMQSRNDKMTRDSIAQLERETQRVASMSGFIEAVSSGNYEIELNNSDKDDNLTNTLLTMRNKLKQNGDDDRKRNWNTSGLAQIGEILRANTTSSIELYDNIIRFVVKYTGSNQGGMFLLNDDNDRTKFLELVSCYAFERKKFVQKKIEIGEGLIGQCFLEGARILMLQLPQDYVSITSGLGGATPSALLLVPMKINEKIYGVIEIASFKKYEDFEIDLIEKFAESIASTISTVKINESTRILLEKTQQQAEEMKSQEEEMRQNMEELSATQEEMSRKEKEYISRIKELESLTK